MSTAADRPHVVAYFSMEIALEPGIPTYSGGLGVLAGDTLRAAADLKVPMVAVTLLHRKGYFYQRLDPTGWQHEEPVAWVVDDFLEEMPARATVTLEGRTVHLRAWKYEVKGVGGAVVPVYLLDTNLPENSEWDRTLTDVLYGGDRHHRLCQEAVLGLGGVRMLRALGYENVARFHLNEGHAALLTLALLDEHAAREGRVAFTQADVERVRPLCVFTTHTPVPAGHDKFPMEMVTQVLARADLAAMPEIFCCEGALNMTHLALNLSHYVNGVARKHAEVSRQMFAPYQIDAITNGVHAATWTSPPFAALFDRYLPGWREDNFSLRYALSIPPQEIWDAHRQAKRDLLRHVNRETNAGLEADVLTIGFARRAAPYKRADLLIRDPGRLKRIAANAGPLQVLFAGKAHPQDHGGKELIQRIVQARHALRNDLKIAYLANYDWELGKRMTAGVDVWLNTPQPPLEASGTSGMKAAMNGVPSLSVLDGWWIEGHTEGVTGWAIGERCDLGRGPEDRAACDAASLYDQLENVVLPLFYHRRDQFISVMRHAIALNGSFFNTHRMVLQYVLKAYFREKANDRRNHRGTIA
ncbi:MAG: alpha-glucan family phosphorylase [Planctomycetes bacterium]|nr:alpha-glucan family phosphorylase [Planctomycetota bacterium]